MKGVNKTETPIFLSVVCSLFQKAIFLTFILLIRKPYVLKHNRLQVELQLPKFQLVIHLKRI